MVDTKFSVAIHLLILVSESESPMSSAQMAKSVGTNPSFVRKVLGLLKKARLIDSHRGRAGFTLEKPADGITMLQVYQAIYGDDHLDLFEMHKNPNDKCVVGRYIRPTLEKVLGNAQHEAESALASTTLSDCIDDMRRRASAESLL